MEQVCVALVCNRRREIKFACVDGPEFDGHLVNFDECNEETADVQDSGGSCNAEITGR